MKKDIKMHRVSPGNYVSADGRFRAWREGCDWFALDMRITAILTRRDTYAEIKRFLSEYAAREAWRREQDFWRIVYRTIAEEG